MQCKWYFKEKEILAQLYIFTFEVIITNYSFQRIA